MPKWIDVLLCRANDTAQQATANLNAEQIGAFCNTLSQQQKIRFYVGTGGGRGNQSATVNLLRRFATPRTTIDLTLTYGYAGLIEVYYEADTLERIYDLLPEVPRGSDTGPIYGATVLLRPYNDENPPQERVEFGFTGAADFSDKNFADKLNVVYFLQLQPYNYNFAEKIWFNSNTYPQRQAIDLSQPEELNSPSFKRRLFYIPETSYNNPNWDTYTNVKAQILRYLTSDDILGQVKLVVSYSIMQPLANVINNNPDSAAMILCGGLLQWQDNVSYERARPVIILNLNEYGGPDDDSHLRCVERLLQGEMTDRDIILSNPNREGAQQARNTYLARASYLESLDAEERFSYINYPSSVAQVRASVEGILNHNDRVLFIQLGAVPQQLYYYALFKQNIFSTFEGNNSAMAAFNIGKPFLLLPRFGATARNRSNLYPNINRGSFSSSPPIGSLKKAANQLNVNLESWPKSTGSNPCYLLGRFLQTLTDRAEPADPIPKYFQDIKNTFSRPEEDKLGVSLAYLMNIYQSDHQQPNALAGKPSIARENDDNPLDSLYLTLKDIAKPGEKVDLIPGAMPTGNIHNIIMDFLKDSLWLKVEKFYCEPDENSIKKITLIGTTEVLRDLQLTNRITVVFDAPDKKLRINVRFETGADDMWSIEGVPWIQLYNPFVQFTVSEGKIPVIASAGGTYKPLGSHLSVLIPSAEDQWLATASFDKPYPSIDRAFQMAASVNLVEMLPSPLNILSDLGLSRVELYYEKQKVSSLGFIIENNSPDPLPLVGKIALSNIVVRAAVIEPQSSSEVQVVASGQFKIGSSENAGIIDVSASYPNFTFEGSLTAGKIELKDLIDTFLPGTELNLPTLPAIDQFSFNYSKESNNLVASMNFKMDNWVFTFSGKTLFSIENIGFLITRNKESNTGNITGHTTLLPKSESPIGVDIGAYYIGNGAWKFDAKTTTIIDIDALMKEYLPDWQPIIALPKLKDLSLSLEWSKDKKGTSFEFSGKTAEPWVPIRELPQISATFDFKVGYKSGDKNVELAARDDLFWAIVPAGSEDKTPGPYGELSANITIWNIHLQVAYNFDPDVKKVCLTWVGVGKACIQKDEKTKDTIATFNFEKTSIGEMVERFVSWATGAKFGLVAPWNVLNEISLSKFELTYNFTKKKVSFGISIGPVDLGLFKLKGVSLEYNPENKSGEKVQITVDGQFVWEKGDSISWNPDNPSSTPTPPGSGNKYLDLRLLAAGQHVTVEGLTEQRKVQDAIALLRDLKIPNPPEIPVGGTGQPIFAPESSWFIAFNFGVLRTEKKKQDSFVALPYRRDDMALPAPASHAIAAKEESPYFLDLSVIFNDPNFYALQVRLDGPMAKVFAGLGFQIMYRQISETVGCYSAEVALPNLMRKFQVGVATITLPVFAVDVYTNGDFQIDVGFPWNQDFSRSFTIELIVLGVPVIGAAGFYFGKLSSATTNKVPQTNKGYFNPVIIFGFGAQIGLGKSFEAGILRAGFSLVVFGIIEGILARWLPYSSSTYIGDRNQLQDGYFFSITGTLGVLGRLYGSVDFAIIKADLNVEIKIYVRVTFASYEPIPITARASIDVSLSVVINLGLFKITFHLSFKSQVEATFVLENPMKPPAPWGENKEVDSYRALYCRRINKAMALSADGLLAASSYVPNWENLQKGSTIQLNGWVAPALTVAGDYAASPKEQQVCYVTCFILPTPEPIQVAPNGIKAVGCNGSSGAMIVMPSEVAHAALARARSQLAKAALNEMEPALFEDFAIRVLQWVIAAGMKSLTPEELDKQVVSDDFLGNALNYLSGKTTPTPIPIPAIESFLSLHTEFVFSLCSENRAENGVFFPAPPGITLEVPDFGEWKGYRYSFGEYNSSSSIYLNALNDYFNQLKIQVEKEQKQQRYHQTCATSAYDGPSIASYIFGDYFAMIGRLAVQAMRDGLRNYKLVIEDQKGKTIREIVEWVNTTGRLGELPREKIFTAGQLFASNLEHRLNNKSSLTISGMTRQISESKSFSDIANDPIFNKSFNGSELALNTANSSNGKIIAANVKLVLAGNEYLTQSGDSLETIASRVNLPLETLVKQKDIIDNPALIKPQAILEIPDFKYITADGNTLKSIISLFGVALDDLADKNMDLTGLFDSSNDPNLNIPHLAQFQVGALIDEMRRTLALQHLGAMVSRYYLHGLRLPTSLPNGQGLKANKRGLFVSGDSPENFKYPGELGLFALTGQAFPLPNIPDPSKQKKEGPRFSFSLIRDKDANWLKFGNKQEILTYILQEKNDYDRYNAVRDFAGENYLNVEMKPVEFLPTSESEPGRYPLSIEIQWQAASSVTLPNQEVSPSVPSLRLWALPNTLVNLPQEDGILPTFKPVLVWTDETTGKTAEEDISNYGFGTLITFTLRKIEAIEGCNATKRMYEIIGAPESEIALLERLLNQTAGKDDVFQQMFLLYPPSSSASETKGWQSDDPLSSLMGISQANLSTETHPPTFIASDRFLSDEKTPEHPNVINGFSEFLRLLWEASITRQGGFYLSYTAGMASGDAGDLKGLPDRIFNDHREAEVAVLSLYKSSGKTGQMVADYMNVISTNQQLDLSNSALIAEAVPIEIDNIKFADTDKTNTIAKIAAAYYMDPGIFAELNAAKEFASGSIVSVPGGAYEVSPFGEQPGGRLEDIAAYFNTNIAAIKLANPRWTDWPESLPPLSSIKLPDVVAKIEESRGCKSFSDLSKYYRVPIAEIASMNLNTKELYPKDTEVRVIVGPFHQVPAIQEGVCGLKIKRNAPALLPDAPIDSNWSKIYLQRIFSLLSYRVAENPDFAQSNRGLPSGAVNPEAEKDADKIQAPRLETADDIWHYVCTAPYPGLAKLSGNGLDISSPYRGVGGILQFDLTWLDVFGNSILSELDDPRPTNRLQINRPPQILGYVDRLIGLGQWPSVASAYHIQKSDGKPCLELALFFDKSNYEDASIEAIQGIKSGKQKIDQALFVYTKILNQLKDADPGEEGSSRVRISLATTLMPSLDQLLSKEQERGLVAWVESIYKYLASLVPNESAKDAANSDDFEPEHTISVILDLKNISKEQIFKLKTSLTIRRRPQLVEGCLRNVAEVGSTSTTIAPWTGSFKDIEMEPRSLIKFSEQFTSAFEGTAGISFHISIGSDRSEFMSGNRPTIWVVQLGELEEPISYSIVNKGKPKVFAPRPISNKLVSKSETPIIPFKSGKIISLDDPCTVKSFASIDLDQWLRVVLAEVDAILAPNYIAPAQILRYKTQVDSMQKVLDAKKALASALKRLMIPIYNDEIATKDEIDAIQEVFKQRMLSRVNEFYQVKAGIQFEAKVNSAIKKLPGSIEVPRLYGDIVINEAANLYKDSPVIEGNFSVSSPKLDLKFEDGSGSPRPYLSSLISSTSANKKRVTLNLDYRGQYIEQEIRELNGIDGYKPSSWLSFVEDTSKKWPLKVELGQFEVPIVLRAFPLTPTLIRQREILDSKKTILSASDVQLRESLPSEPDCTRIGDYNPFSKISKWNYGIEYSVQVHYPQEAIHAKISFNVLDRKKLGMAADPERDLFDNLAEFIEEFPKVKSDLDNYLAPIDVNLDAKSQMAINAESALESAAVLINWIADSFNRLGKVQDRFEIDAGRNVPPIKLIITEDGVKRTYPDGKSINALQITVALCTPLPAGIGKPFVEIDGYVCIPDPSGGDDKKFPYLYTKDGSYLPAETAATIPQRELILQDLEILERQDAQTEIYLTRNEELIPGKRIAGPFVYTTPTVSFPDPLHPTVFYDKRVDIASIYTKESGREPSKRSLSCHLKMLYEALFGNAGTDSVTLQMNSYYKYKINANLQYIQLPVFLMPPTLTALIEGNEGEDLSKIIEKQVKGWETWQNTCKPETLGGELIFELIVMSNLTARPMPILQLSELFLSIDDIKL